VLRCTNSSHRINFEFRKTLEETDTIEAIKNGSTDKTKIMCKEWKETAYSTWCYGVVLLQG
jgi:hypothetical protein